MKCGEDIMELQNIKNKIETVLKDINALINKVEKGTSVSSTGLKTETGSVAVPKIELKPPVPPATTQPTISAKSPSAGVMPAQSGEEKREASALPSQNNNQDVSPQNKKLENMIYELLKNKNEPMSFEEIYSELEKSGVSLPPDKPKLVVRKILYNPKRFTTVKGMFKIV